MSEDISKSLIGKNRSDITTFLGEPDWQCNDEFEGSATYFLRKESFVFGIRCAELVVHYNGKKCVFVSINHPD